MDRFSPPVLGMKGGHMRVHQSTYGRAALDRLAQVVADVKSADPMASVVVVAPNNLAGIVARRHLAAGLSGFGGVAGLEVTTLPRFAEQIAAPRMAPRRPATRPVISAAWRGQLQEAPGLFADVAEHPATVSALARTYVELCEVSTDGLAKISAASDLGRDLVRLHRAVREQLAVDWYDATQLLEDASAAVEESGFTTPVVLYLPQVLTRSERRFVAALGDAAPVEVILGATGARRADDAVHAPFRTEEMPRSSVATAQRVLHSSDSDDEVRCVVRDVVAALESTPASRIAILYAVRSPYARLLHEQLAGAGIAVNGPGIRPVQERGVARTLQEILALVDSDVPRADLFRALANGPTRDFHGSRIPLATWERTSRAAGVVRGDDWDTRLGRYADQERRQADEIVDDDESWRIERHLRNAETAEALRGFATTLRRTLRDLATMTSWSDLSAGVLALFGTLVGEPESLTALPPEEQYAAATILTVLRSTGTLTGLAGSASLRTLRDVMDTELAAAIPRVGRFGDGVLVAPLSAAVGLDLDLVFVVGLSEDQYPGTLHQDALLPTRVRAQLPGELADARQQLDDQFRDLLAAFASATTAVAAFPRGDLRRSTRRLPSRWLLGTLRELTGNHRLAASDWEDAANVAPIDGAGSFAGQLLTTTRLATEQEWRVRAAAVDTLEDSVLAAATEMIRARATDNFTRYDGNLTGAAGLPDYAREERKISPTALESYAECPHAFFVQRLLGVEPLEQPEDIVQISPADLGTFVHECVDQLVREFTDDLPGVGGTWTAGQRTRLLAIAEEKARDFEARGLTGHPRLWAPARAAISRTLLEMLDEDDRWRAENSAAVLASELAFGMKGHDPVEVPITGGRVLMRGSADKVDRSSARLLVTDIKTGSKRKFKGISQDDPLLGGTRLQLPVYGYAARQRHGDPATPVTASYWFVHREAGRIDIELTADVEQLFAQTLEILVGSIAAGLFPARAPEQADFSWVQCAYCNPDGIGHSEQRERWERKRKDPALATLVALVEPVLGGGA